MRNSLKNLLFLILLFIFPLYSYPVNSSKMDARQIPNLILFNGTIHTMEETQPMIEAIAVQGDQIIKLGNELEVLDLAVENTTIINLQGLTLFPGFIDSHSHWIGDRNIETQTTAEEQQAIAIESVIENGWTSISELFVNQDRLNELIDLDSKNQLRIRVNSYLPLSWATERFGNWYQSYQPGYEYSSNLRIGGVKIFFENFIEGTLKIWFNQSEYNDLVKEAHDLGFQIATHSYSTNSIEIILTVFENLLKDGPFSDHRHRIEHLIALRDSQILKMNELDIIASIQLTWLNSNYNDWVEERLVDNNFNLSQVARWKDLVSGGVKIIGSTDFPWNRGSIGSVPMSIYSAVTRIGSDGLDPTANMLNQRLSVDEVLRSITIDAAYGTFQDDVKGSIKEGKLADFVLLSKDPYSSSSSELLDMKIIMSIIGGTVEYCNEGFNALCIGNQTSDVASTPSFQVLMFFIAVLAIIINSKRKSI